MSFGFLHFNLSNALRADLINQSLAKLINSHESIAKVDFEDRLCASNSHSDLITICKDIILDPKDYALALKILENVFCNHYSNYLLDKNQSVYFLKELLSFLDHLKKIDPQFISSSFIPLDDAQNGFVQNTLLNLPTKKSVEKVYLDVFGIAFLKSTCMEYGPKADGISISIGYAQENDAYLEVVLTQSAMPNTIGVQSPLSTPKEFSLFQVSGMVDLNVNLTELISKLIHLKAKNISYANIFDKNLQAKINFSFMGEQKYKQNLLKEFFKYSHTITLTSVVNLEPVKNLISLPIGSKNQHSFCRFYEYILFDEIIKVEPLKEDLLKYALEIEESLDIAKENLMSIYHKWHKILHK